ncbi:hypothetical protein PHLGIDRAFT_76458 [Phlebiopsis gigantea 11061_1 CR5-6]|uniref:Replication protein A OB domain-containing protein n=1 Tax=Phlebiopsis gigantea (strain 11061_1 CR5-6) TaxID=745531 RepID=A0A0C3RTP8_PHLG1|nr:hypothetical protein PHLGIDRAFT_76458 [Phlebiopsis gigantea 11061_1 CR5-6]
MPRYRVFLKAPSLSDLKASGEGTDFRWQTVELSRPQDAIPSDETQLSFGNFEAASRRISRFYENIIFKDIHEDGEEKYDAQLSSDEAGDPPGNTQEYTAYITWMPTTAGDRTRLSQSGFVGKRDGTFLRGFDSRIAETQETQETASYSEAGVGASDTSIARFPENHFSLHSLSSLTVLERGMPAAARANKVNLLVAIMEVEGPDTIHIKKGPDSGKEVSILKIIVGDEHGGVCRLTAWREVAEQWGGSYANTPAPSLKRGDVVYLQSVFLPMLLYILVSKDVPAPAAANTAATSSISLTASPAMSSAMSICYRTMPVGDKAVDSKLRPDLRLGFSDAAVRKVAAVVRWFQGVAGLPLL